MMLVSGICPFVRPSARFMTSASRPARVLDRPLLHQPLTAPSRTFKSVSAPIELKPFTKARGTRGFRIMAKSMWSHDDSSPTQKANPIVQALQSDKEDEEMALKIQKYIESITDPLDISEVQAPSNQSAFKDPVSSLNTSSSVQTDPDLNSKVAFASSFVLTAEGAQLAMKAAEKEATKQGWNVTIAVVDAGGHLMALKRMDGAMPVASMIAYNKARSAILFAKDTKLLEAGVNGSGGGERHALLSTGEVLMEGGVPVIDSASMRVVAACGVSGVKPGEDAQVAHAGVQALLQVLSSKVQ